MCQNNQLFHIFCENMSKILTLIPDQPRAVWGSESGLLSIICNHLIWDRCYDFKNIWPKNLPFFAQTTASFCKKLDHNIGF
jgi:hypothetical protein